MKDKNKSILEVVLKKVSKLSWLKGTREPDNKNMRPGKGFNEPVSDHAFDYLKELNDAEFEKLVSLIFKQRGYLVTEKGEEEYEGVDAVLRVNNQSTFVQYKHWREHHINNDAIEELKSIMENESVPHGIIITTGIFTDEALESALDCERGKSLLLINGVDLSLMVDALSASNDAGTLESELEDDVEEPQMPELEPLCPICSREMILRTAKKGKNAGNTFWGCSQYPNCRGVTSN